MSRFYCPHPLHLHSEIRLPEEIAHHLHVLRLQAGARINLFDGEGREVVATLSTLEKKSATAAILQNIDNPSELPYSLTLAQGLPEGSKMDWIIEKAIELGAGAIQPLAAQRSVVKLTTERAAKRRLHWQGIIVAASEQSGRTRLADLAEVMEPARWAAQAHPAQKLLLSPRSQQSLASWVANTSPQALTILVGPEGGFNDQEEKLLISQGAIPLSMGPRILRTETAGLAALAVINAAWGQM